MFSLIKPKKCALALLGSAILAFGLYNVHALSGVTEGGVLGMTLFLYHWVGLSPAVTGLVNLESSVRPSSKSGLILAEKRARALAKSSQQISSNVFKTACGAEVWNSSSITRCTWLGLFFIASAKAFFSTGP